MIERTLSDFSSRKILRSSAFVGVAPAFQNSSLHFEEQNFLPFFLGNRSGQFRHLDIPVGDDVDIN